MPMPCHFIHFQLQAFPDNKYEQKITINSDIGLPTFTFVQMPVQWGYI